MAEYLLLAVLGIAAYLMIKNERNEWKVIYSDYGSNASLVEEKYVFLRQNNIRCRLKTRLMSLLIAGSALLVHVDDIDRAKELLKEKNKNQ